MFTTEGAMLDNRLKAAVILFMLLIPSLVSASAIQGKLNKILFYNSVGEYPKALEIVDGIGALCLQGNKRASTLNQLVKVGNFYMGHELYEEAEKVYRKVLEHGGDEFWYLYNRIRDIDSRKGSWFSSPANLFGQMGMVMRNFQTGFLLMNSAVRIFFFSVIIAFFIFSLSLGIRYYPLMSNDVLIKDNGKIDVKKTLLVVIFLLAPVLMFNGWGGYGFLITGFFWGYLKSSEKITLKIVVGLILVTGIFYSFTRVVEENARSEDFRLGERVYSGKVTDYSGIQVKDNELKVLIATRIYENRDTEESSLEKSLDILLSTGDSYKSIRKFNLMGNIYFFLGKINESLNMYRSALTIDPSSEVVLNNFTMALLTSSEPNKERVFKSFSKVYPQISEIRTRVTRIRCFKDNGTFLWRRILAPKDGNINLYSLLASVFTNFIFSPVFIFTLIFIAYVLLIERSFGNFSESTNCSKCGKIVKLYNVHHSYKMCDECHQLFLIKDVVFLEAKLIKERELQGRNNRNYFISMLFSLIIPGVGFRKRRFWLFALSMIYVYFFLGFYFYNNLFFTSEFTTPPVFLDISLILGLIIYSAVNIGAVAGDEYGV